MTGEGMNVRGPCSTCGTPLATDQRYCIECGQRVGPPLALPYALAPRGGEPPPATGWLTALPIPIQTASTFAALALGFGVVVGTAISPNLSSILASPPGPTVVAEQPPAQSPSTSGGGGGSAAPAPAAAPAAVASTTPASSGGTSGGGGGGGGSPKKKKKSPAAPITFSGTVVRTNPVAQSYVVSASGGLIAIHADTPPKVGDQVESDVRKLNNGTWAENSRTPTGSANVASFRGTVTYCADLEHPSAPCDGSSSADHYVYSVSSLGVSVLVDWPHSATNPPPKVGAQVQVGVHIGDAFQPIEPDSWATDPSCAPPYDEQNGLPSPMPTLPDLIQTSLSATGQATNTVLESVVQSACPDGGSPRLILSADDVREAGRDLGPLAVPNGIDSAKLHPGEAVQVAVDVAGDGTLSLTGITSDQGAAGADDATQGQGSLAGS